MGEPVLAPKLPLALRRLAEAMEHGIDAPYFPGIHREIAPGTPLPLRLAALAVGCRVRRAEAAAMTQPFLDALAAEVALRRESDDPSKLALAIEARDNGDAPDARLEAIEALRVKQPVRPTPRKAVTGLMAERKAGQLLRGMAEKGERHPGGNLSSSVEPKLSDLGVTKKQSHNWQKLGAMDDEALAEPETPPGFFPAPWLEKEGRVEPPAPPAPAPPVPGTLNAHPMYREPAFKGPSQPGAYQGPRAIRVAPRLGQHR